MITNVDPDTGIRYGVISGNSLDSNLLCELQDSGDNDSYIAWRADKANEIKREIENGVYGEIDPDEVESEVDRLLEAASESYESNEDNYSGEKDGVKYQISWLGGAPLVWALGGLIGCANRLCSPCVPGAADLDGGYEVGEKLLEGGAGFMCYVVPRDWLNSEDGEVMGLDTDGKIKVWNIEANSAQNTGETMDEYGIDNMQAFELQRCYESFNAYTDAEIDEFTKHYLVAALWSSTYSKEDDMEGNNPKPIDDDYDVDDVEPESVASARSDVVDFVQACTRLGINLKDTDTFHRNEEWSVVAQHGHDLWLTRAGHGCGFWDRGYGEVGDKLTEVCKAMGEQYIDVIDGKVVLS